MREYPVCRLHSCVSKVINCEQAEIIKIALLPFAVISMLKFMCLFHLKLLIVTVSCGLLIDLLENLYDRQLKIISYIFVTVRN